MPIYTVCHCRDCQRFTGSAFAALVGVPKEALTIDGSMNPHSPDEVAILSILTSVLI